MRLRHSAALCAALFSAITPITAVLGGSGAAAATTTTVVVKNSNFNALGWGSPWDASTGTAVLSEVPAGAPLGIGSLGITLASPTDHRQVYNYMYSICISGPSCTDPGTPLPSIDAMSYSTYKNAASPAGTVPTYALEIDPDSTTPTGVDYTTIQWEPAHNGGGVLDDTWQTWDVLGGGAGVFYSTRDLTGYGVFECPAFTCTATWSDIVTNLPNSIVKYGVGVNAGSGWSSLAASVDAFTLGVAGNTTIYDFEPQCSTVCYVDAATGNDANTGGQPTDAVKTIQQGIDMVSSGGTVNVAAGTYAENVRLNKPVNLAGAGAATTIVVPAVSVPNPCVGSSLCGSATAASNVMLVEADDVTISGFTIDGDNPDPVVTSGLTVGGVDIDARNGIIENYYSAAPTWENLVVHDVTVQNIYLRGIYASSGGSFDIHDNSVTNVQGESASIAMMNWVGSGSFTNNTVSASNDGIVSNHSSGTAYIGNVVSGTPSGIHSDNAGDGGGTADLIQGNTVSSCAPGGWGVWVFVPYIAATVTENTVTACDVGLGAIGGALAGPTVTSSFTKNTVDGVSAPTGSVGLYVDTDSFGWGEANNSVSASNNFITNFEAGVAVEEGSGALATLTMHNNSITGNTSGVPDTTTATAPDLTSNWWGSNTGPTNPANAPGTGQSIGSGVTFSPWLCSGSDTAPATPGFQPAAGTCIWGGTVGVSGDVSTVEGNSGSHTVSIPLTLTPAFPAGAITVGWQTVPATAISTTKLADFVTGSGTATILAGDTTGTINVTVKGDVKLEQFESFSVVLTGANAVLGDTSATVTIENDELPKVTLLGTQVSEGAPAKFTVKLLQQYYAPLALSFSTNDTGTAKSINGDFVAVSGQTVTVPAGLTGAIAWVTTLLDGVPESVVETIKATVTGGKAPANGTAKIKKNTT